MKDDTKPPPSEQNLRLRLEKNKGKAPNMGFQCDYFELSVGQKTVGTYICSTKKWPRQMIRFANHKKITHLIVGIGPSLFANRF